MSIKSMTGYGRGAVAARGIRVEVELSSVNRKQFDVRLNLPRGAAALEARVIESIQQAVARGQINGEVVIHASDKARSKGVAVDAALAATYLRAIRNAAARLRLKDDLNASQLLGLPEVVRYHYPQEDVDTVWPVVSTALKKALQALIRMRGIEGAALAADIERRLARLSAAVKRIHARAPRVTEHYRRTLHARLAAAGLKLASSDPQLNKELAFFAERSDITEEITRLESHLAQARHSLHKTEPVGRTLDFMVQEMFREINTIGSKANDMTISREVIKFKAELERVREQVQNIE